MCFHRLVYTFYKLRSFTCFVTGPLRERMLKNMSRSREKRETKIQAGVRRNASEWSWQAAFVSPLFFSFFFKVCDSEKKKKNQSPCWVGDGCSCVVALRFLCRVILAGDDENGPSPAKSRLTISFLCSVFPVRGWGGGSTTFFYSSHSLSFLFWTWPSREAPQPDWVSVQAASFLYTEGMRRGWAEPQKGQLPSLFRILISFLSLSLSLFLPLPSTSRGAEEEESQSKVHRVRLRMYNSPNGLTGTVWFDARHGLRVPSGPSVPYRRNRLSAATHCGVMRSWTSRCVLQCFYFYFFGEREREWRSGRGLHLHCSKAKTSPGCYIYLFIYLCDRSLKTSSSSSSRHKVPHLTRFWCTWIPLLFSTEKKENWCLVFIFLGVVTFKTLLWKTVAPEQVPIAHSLIKNVNLCCFSLRDYI